MAAEALAKVFQKVEANLKDPNGTKLSIARKREYVFTVQELIKQLEPRKMIQIQAAVINFVFQLASQTQSGSMVAGLIGLVRFMYQNGADFTKLVTEFFEPAIAVIQNARTPPEFRLTMITMTGKVFKTLWMRCSTPPAKELFDSYTKLNTKTTEKHVRAAAYRSLKYVIKGNPSNLFQIQNDLIKHLIKQVKDEKSNVVKAEIAACLAVFVSDTMNYSNMHTSFELLWSSFLKGFEEVEEMSVHQNFVKACTALLNMRLQESQQQGDIKTGYKQYNLQLRESLAQGQTKKMKGKEQQVLEVPRSFGDIVSMFSAMLLRLLANVSSSQAGGETSELTSAQEGIRKAICQVLCQISQKNVAHLEATDVEIILNSLILTIPTARDEPEESSRHRLSVVWTVQRFIEHMQEEQKILLLKLCIQTLSQQQLILKMETLQSLTALLPKNFKVSTMLNEAQHTALLQIANEIIHATQCKTLQSNFSSERDFVDAVTPYMQQPSPYSVRTTGVEVLKTLGRKVSAWSQSLITSLLSMVTISNADLLSLKQEAVYVTEAVKDKDARARIIDQIRTLNVNAMALAGVFQFASRAASGVPVALSSASINLSQGLILGTLPLEVKNDQDKLRFNLSNIDSITNQRREAGWILMEGIIQLGQDWIQSQQLILMKLFKSVFRKEICNIELEKMTQPVYRETVFNEFMIKKRAISCLKMLLQLVNMHSDQQKTQLRQISSMVCNAINFFFNHGDRQDIDRMLHKQFGTNQIQGAKADLFACLLLLPQEAFQQKNVALLHPIVEVIIHEDGGPSKIPSIYRKLLNKDDSHIKPTISQIEKSEKVSKKNAGAQKGPKEVEIQTSGCLWGISDLTDYTRLVIKSRIKDFLDKTGLVPVHDALNCYPRQNLLNNAIELFSKIFLSGSLNNKNKNQLLKHFTINVQPSAPQEASKDKKQAQAAQLAGELPYYRPEKTYKMIRIALTLLNIVKSVGEESSQQRIGEEQFAMILAIISSIELSNNDFLVRIVSEIQVLLYAHKITEQPSEVMNEVISEVEKDVGNGQPPGQISKVQMAQRVVKLQKASAILGLLHRHFDYESLLAPFSERMSVMMTKIFKDESPQVRRFSQHFITVMAIEGPCEQIFYEKAFLNCFHLCLVDSKPDRLCIVSLGKLFNTYTKVVGEIDARNKVTQSDLLDSLVEHKPTQEKSELLMVALDTIKYQTFRHQEVFADPKYKTKIFETIFKLLQDSQIQTKVKVKVTEILASLIYKGHLYGLDAETKQSLSRIILDQMNLKIEEYTQEDLVDISDALSSNEQFEKLINFSAEFNLESAEDEDRCQFAQPNAASRVFQQCLQRLFLLVFKMQCLSDFKEATQFCKNMLAYKHTTPFTILERVMTDGQQAQEPQVGENYIFKQDMKDETRCFVMKTFQTYVHLFYQLDTTAEQSVYKAEAGSLLNLGFTTVSYDDEQLKKIGFNLILSVIDILSQVIDRVQDDADDDDEDQFQSAQSQHKKKVKEFVENSLLLEQYEAQIFSIIRQNLKIGQSQLPQSVLEKVFQLILKYVTLPICKDEKTIAKIRDLLLQGCTIAPSSIYSANLNASESVLAHSHIQKLILLSQLIMFSKNGKDYLSDQDGVCQKLDKTLPSKFIKEDCTRLQDVMINGQHRDILVSHLIGCLNDSLIINLGKRANTAKSQLLTFGQCYPNSALGQCLQKSVKYALEALSILMSDCGQGSLQLNPQQSKTITLSLLQTLSSHDISGSFGAASIKTYSQSKLVELVQAKSFIENESCTVLTSTPNELSEFCDTLISMLKMRICEVNQMVLHLIQSLIQKSFFGVFNALMQTQKLQQFVDLISELLLQALPAINESGAATENQSSGFEMGQASSLAKKDLNVPTIIALAQTKALLAVMFAIVKNAKDNASDLGAIEAAQKALACTIGRIACNIESLPQATPDEQAFKKEIAGQGANTITVVNQTLHDSPQLFTTAVVPVYLSAIQLASSNGAGFGPMTGYLIQQMLVAFSQTKDQTTSIEARLALTSGDHPMFTDSLTTQAQEMLKQSARDPLTGAVGQSIITQVVVGAYTELKKDKPDERAVLLALAFMLQFFKNKADCNLRVTLLRPLFTILFTAMQASSFSAQARNQSVDILHQMFQTDPIAFRKFAEPEPATGQSWLTMAEKDIISKVVQKYAAMQQQAQPALNAGQGQQKQPANAVKMPLATAGGNKIKLGRFGKK